MLRRRSIQLQILSGKQDIKEVVSEKVELGEDSNIMSLPLARAMGTKITRMYNQLELIDKRPMSIYGTTKILVRLSPEPKTLPHDRKFIKIEMKICEHIDTKMRISKHTQRLLNI